MGADLPSICSWIQVYDKRTRKRSYHFKTHFDDGGSTALLESSRLILKQIKTIAGSTSPVIFTGDLNTTPDPNAYRTIISNTALKDTKTLSKTGHCGENRTFSSFTIAAEMGDLIDYIFVTLQFKVLQHGALKDSNNGFYPSNHLPVISKITFKNITSH